MPRKRTYETDAERVAAWRLRKEREKQEDGALAIDARSLHSTILAAANRGDALAVLIAGGTAEETLRNLRHHFQKG